VVVLGDPANHCLRIDSRAAANPTPLDIQRSGLGGGATDTQRWPVILGVRKERKWIGTLYLDGSLRGTVIASSFQEEHRTLRVFRDRRGQRRSCRSCPNNKIVVWH